MAKRQKEHNRSAQVIWWIVFVLYTGIMLWLLLGRSQTWISGFSYQQMLLENMNLKPFFTIGNYLNIIFHYPDSIYFRHCIINLLGNVLLFIPAGLLVPRLIKPTQNFFLFLLIAVLCILFVEFIQLLALLGSFDVDDIILNLFGMLIGFIIFHCIK